MRQDASFYPCQKKWQTGTASARDTGIFELEEVNRDLNQKVQKRIKLFEHQKKILGRPSSDGVSRGEQAIEYIAQKVAATPIVFVIMLPTTMPIC
jgi:hypothetical protein